MFPSSCNPDPQFKREVWISQHDEHGRVADPKFLAAAYALADRLLTYRQRELRDMSRASELLEDAVHSASRSHHEEPVRNFAGYLVRRFTRIVDSVVHREKRVEYVEPAVLAEKHYTLDEDLKRLEDRLRLNEVMSQMDSETERICIRMLDGYKMTEIARELGIEANTLRLRFRRGCKKALERLEAGDSPPR